MCLIECWSTTIKYNQHYLFVAWYFDVISNIFPIAIKSRPWVKCDVFHLLWLFLVTLTPSHPKCKTFQRQWEGQDREWSLSFLSRRRDALVLPPGRQKGSARLYFLRNVFCKCKIENFHLASVRSDTSRGDWGEHDEAWQRPDID